MAHLRPRNSFQLSISEFGFLLFFLALTAATAIWADADQAREEAKAAQAENRRHRDSLERQEARLAALQSATRRLQDLVDSLERRKMERSYCHKIENLGMPQFIASIGIVDSNRYAVAGDTLSIQELRTRFAAEIAKSEELDCCMQARVFGGRIDYPTYSHAEGKLEATFCLKRVKEPAW